MRRSMRRASAVAALACCASAQVNLFVGNPANPTYYIDFDNPFVASGAIASTSLVFTASGLASVDAVGTWNVGGDSITAASNGSGQSLVVDSGVLSIAGINQPLDGPAAGAGFDLRLSTLATAVGVLFIDQINFTYQVELFQGANSLGAGNFAYSGSFPAPGHYWTSSSTFDRVLITWPTATAGVGIDNLAIISTGPIVPTVYCTSGTSSNGCAAAISTTAQPSVSFANACNVSVSGVEGLRSGIVFYGLASIAQPWCSMGGGTSYVCVKSPTMRSAVQNSGGNLGQCNGALALNWHAFQQAQPTVLGAPWSAGNKCYVQGWFQNPGSCKSSGLSNALELTWLP